MELVNLILLRDVSVNGMVSLGMKMDRKVWNKYINSPSPMGMRVGLNFERAVEGSILTAGKKVESENLNVIIRTINLLV